MEVARLARYVNSRRYLVILSQATSPCGFEHCIRLRGAQVCPHTGLFYLDWGLDALTLSQKVGRDALGTKDKKELFLHSPRLS